MNARERRLANDAHYRRLANTAKFNTTYINPRYPTGQSDYGQAPPEHLEQDMYHASYPQQGYEPPMLRPPPAAGFAEMDAFSRYPMERRHAVDHYEPPLAPRPGTEALSMRQNALQQQMYQLQNTLDALSVQQRNLPLPLPRDENGVSAHATGRSLAAADRQARDQQALESHQEVAQLRQQLEEQKLATEAEIAKRLEAEKKEQSAIKHQSSLGREKHELETEIANLKKSLQAALADKADVSRRLEDAYRQNQLLERGNDVHRENLARQTAQTARYKDQMMSLRFTNEGMNQRAEELKREVESLFEEKNELLKRNAALEEENRRYKAMQQKSSTTRASPSIPAGNQMTDTKGGPGGPTESAPKPNAVFPFVQVNHANTATTLAAQHDPYAELDSVFG